MNSDSAIVQVALSFSLMRKSKRGDVLVQTLTDTVTTRDQFTRKAEGTLEMQLPGQNSCHYILSV